jgi:chemotaxis protein CheD
MTTQTDSLHNIWLLRAEDIQTGEVKAARAGTLLASTAIGSCIAIVAIDPPNRVGGIAHIMLPGRAPQNTDSPKTRYAANGFDELLSQIDMLGGRKENLRVFLVGGANVLMDNDDSICRDNLHAVVRLCETHGIPIEARMVGGIRRYRVILDVERRQVHCGVGDGPEVVLWTYEKGSSQ